MISRIRGTITRWDPDAQTVEIDVHGIGYEVALPTFTWRALEDARPEGEIELFTYYHVAERSPTPVLVGFIRPVEREFFKKFITVRGMGVGKAQKALDTSISTIARWIEDEDEAALKALPGVGARQAGQIVAELRGKVVEEALLRDEQFTAGPRKPGPREQESLLTEAVAALGGLGYRTQEARTLIESALATLDTDQPLDLEMILRAVLQSQAPES